MRGDSPECSVIMAKGQRHLKAGQREIFRGTESQQLSMENGENFLRTQEDVSWTLKLRERSPVWKTDGLAVNHSELSGIL